MKTIVIATLLVGIATALPLAMAGPVLCTETCTIAGFSGGFVPPVQVVQDGASVSWNSLDGNAHVNVDAGVADTCMTPAYGPGGDSDPIRFDISGGTLQAVALAGTPNETVTSCPNAVAVDGGFVLSYFCQLHPVLMKGALVVIPA
jgi:plastocyanin